MKVAPIRRAGTSTCMRGAELIAALMKGPKSVPELMPIIGVHPRSHGGIHRWMREFRASGVVRIVGRKARTRAYVFALQKEVFGEPDQPEVVL